VLTKHKLYDKLEATEKTKMPALLERPSTPETSPKSSTRTRLARVAIQLFEIIPGSPKPVIEKPTSEIIDIANTGNHHITGHATEVTVEKLQAQLAAEEKQRQEQWKQEFDALLPKTPEDRKKVMYELALKDINNTNILLAPDPEASTVIDFPVEKKDVVLPQQPNRK